MAKYIGEVAAAGKKEYALPMYVNAALRDPFNPGKAGDYASGGPTDNVISIYRAAAPAIDIVAPDIYMKESKKAYRVIELYKPGGPLLVPEIGNDPVFARYFYDVLGAQAIGIVPFGMDYTGLFELSAGRRRTSTKPSTAFARPIACWRRWRASGHDSASRNPCGVRPKPDDRSRRTARSRPLDGDAELSTSGSSA